MELTQEDYDAAIKAAVDEATTGLVNKNNELIGERRTDGEKLTASEQSNQALTAAATKAANEQLAKDGKWSELEAGYVKKEADAVAKETENTAKYKTLLENGILEREHNSILSQIAGPHEHMKPAYKALLVSSTKISYNEEGQAVTVIKDGDKEYASAKDFLEGVKESVTWKSVLKGIDSSGANTQNSQSQAGNVDVNKKAQDAIKKRDGVGHLNAHFQEAFK